MTRLHELTGDEWTCFAYDKRGNCTEIEECDGTTYFQYNDTNLVTSIKYKNDVVNRFYYDSRLRRYAMEDSAGLSYFTYDQDGLCQLVERDASGSAVAEYTQGYAPIAGIGDMAAARIITGQGTYYRYDFYDNRGNVIRSVDEAGTVTGYFEYDAWGRKLRNDPPPEATRFGQSAPAWIELTDDPNAALRLTPTRLYHAGLGRFLQRDPKKDSASRYNYVAQNPLGHLDPTGSVIKSRQPLTTYLRAKGITGFKVTHKNGWYCHSGNAIIINTRVQEVLARMIRSCQCYEIAGYTRGEIIRNLEQSYVIGCGVVYKQNSGFTGHGWIEGPGFSAGFWPPAEGSEAAGAVQFPKDPYHGDVAGVDIYRLRLVTYADHPDPKGCWKRVYGKVTEPLCSEILRKLRLLILRSQKNPPSYNWFFYNCRNWAKAILGRACLAKIL